MQSVKRLGRKGSKSDFESKKAMIIGVGFSLF